MWNDSIKVTIGSPGITDLRDLLADPSVNVLNGAGNQLVWYEDDGDLYRFGNEMWDNDKIPNPKFAPMGPQPVFQSPQITKTQDGPLMKEVTVTFSIQDPNSTEMQPFTLTYRLVAGENILRMTTTGAAPSGQTSDNQGYTVMTAFPFNTDAAYLTYGTPYHWDTRAPRNFFTNWPPSSAQAITFEPTHEFLVAQDSTGNDLLAVYHANSVAWGIAPGGVLLGCLLRNTTGHGGAATGFDEAQHTLAYAIRLPGGNLQSPAAGCTVNAPLGEALAYNNPVLGVIALSSTTAQLPSAMSIASTTNATGVITAAKVATANPAQWILRVYQPTNGPLDMAIEVDSNIAKMFQSGGNLNVAAVNAMEAGINGGEFNIGAGPDSFTFTAPRALATFSLTS
jgi:alpha-mannosidase